MHPSREVGRFQMDNLLSRPGDCSRYTARMLLMHCYKCGAVTLLIALCGCAQSEVGNTSATSVRTITVSPGDSKIDLRNGSEIGVDLDGASQRQSIELQATELTNANGESLIDIDRSTVKH